MLTPKEDRDFTKECKEFLSTHSISFFPATWDLVESGESFITFVMNGFDLVSTFSTTSVDYLSA
jgi:hypothetical protein